MKTLTRIRQQISARLERPWVLKYILILIALLGVPFVLAFAAEIMHRGTYADAYAFMMDNGKLFYLNTMVYFLLFVFIYCLVGSLFPAIGVTGIVVGIVALVSYTKMTLMGDPFFPWDIFNGKQGVDLVPYVANAFVMKRLIFVIALGLIVMLLRLVLPKFSLHWIGRVVLGLTALVIIVGMNDKHVPVDRYLYKMGMQNIVWNQQANYLQNGLSLAFMMNMQNAKVAKPDGYDEEMMMALAEQIGEERLAASAERDAKPALADGQMPNVVFIMNEAFWDPTLMTNLTFSEDPLPTVHQLQEEGISGYMLSPQFGGGTSNVEYEILSGHSMTLFPGGSSAYQQYVHKPLPSLASYFANQGYRSMAIHSYEGWFWNRQSVYKNMGFHSFMSKQYFDNPEYKGHFISDAEVSRAIIDKIDTTDEPAFIYAITMQNHGPYADMRYGENPIKVTGNLDSGGTMIAETYTHGAYDADQSLKMLIEHYEASDEPTILIFYGDHLPMLGNDYDVYVQADYISTGVKNDWTLEEHRKMQSIPYVIWANFELPQQSKPIISSTFLGSYVLDLLGMDKPAPFDYGYNLSLKMPGWISSLVIDAEDNMYASVPDFLKDDVARFRQIQYDQLFGKQYLSKYIDTEFLTKPPVDNYNEEYDHYQMPEH